MIRSTSTTQTWERQPWSSGNAQVQAWVNDVVWKTLRGSPEGVEAPPAGGLSNEIVATCREVILHNRLEGLFAHVWGDKLRAALGDEFYKKIETARERTELFLQEVHWIIGPAAGIQIVLIDDYAMRPHYARLAGTSPNPRLIHDLSVWTPTLATREEVHRLLLDGGFDLGPAHERGYVLTKETDGIVHRITLLGTIWEASKNWALDLEHEVWDRTLLYSPTTPMRLESTDLFLFAMRRFSIDSMCGGALALRDVATLVELGVEGLDWDRIRHVKDAFAKPDWIWAALLALQFYEQKTDVALQMPEWVYDGLLKVDSFWNDFIETRLNWANPDLRMIDFPRAFVKTARGT